MDAAAEQLANAGQERLILDAVDRFLERDVRPVVHALEAADTYPIAIVEKLKTLGLFGATIAPGFGGLGLAAVTYARIVERMSAVWMSVPGLFNSHLIMAAAVERNGTEEQKRRYLPRFASGELRGGLALTEPDCGTDLQAIRTHARREGDHYVVNGAKTWITNSAEGQILAVLVKTDPRAEPAHKGMSLLLIEKGYASSTSSAIAASIRPNCCSRTAGCQPRTSSGHRRAAACSRCSAGSSSGASTSRHAGRDLRAPAWRNHCVTRNSARHSASRLRNTRRFRSSSPTWRRASRPRAC